MIGPYPGDADVTENPRERGKPGNSISGPYRAWFTRIGSTLANVGASDVTALRPTSNLFPGLVFFDTTLGKPVFVKTIGPPAVWVDATGAVV